MSNRDKIERLFGICREKGVKIATAESCTGGLVSAALTDVSGSSDVFECGFVTYSNKSKADLLGIPKELIDEKGAVSFEVAVSMAHGALNGTQANLSIAITGVAGPNGTEEKPVGLVYISSKYSLSDNLIKEKHLFSGSRDEIRKSAVNAAVDMLLTQVEN